MYDVVNVRELSVPVRLLTPLDRVSPLRGGDIVVCVVSVCGALSIEGLEAPQYEVDVVAACVPEIVLGNVDPPRATVSSVASPELVKSLVKEEVE